MTWAEFTRRLAGLPAEGAFARTIAAEHRELEQLEKADAELDAWLGG